MMGLHEYTRFSVNDDGSLEYLGKFSDGGLDIIYNAGKFEQHYSYHNMLFVLIFHVLGCTKINSSLYFFIGL